MSRVVQYFDGYYVCWQDKDDNSSPIGDVMPPFCEKCGFRHWPTSSDCLKVRGELLYEYYKPYHYR